MGEYKTWTPRPWATLIWSRSMDPLFLLTPQTVKMIKKINKINTLLYQWSFPTHNILSLRPNSRPIMFETSRSACSDKIGCKRINYVIFCCRIFISYLNFVTRIHALLLTIFGLHSNYAHSQRVTGLQNPIPCTTVTNE